MNLGLKWTINSLSIDLSPLWNVDSGISPSNLSANFSESELTRAWNDFLEKSQEKKIGFFDWPSSSEAKECIALVEKLASTLQEQTQGAICIGIGGSYLGPAALQNIFCPFENVGSFPVEWISNADSFTIERARRMILSRSPLSAVVISKSGGTTETLSAWFHLSHFFKNNNITVITDPVHGELKRLASLLGWHHLPIPQNIGGRFSVLTAVGLLPLALQGVDIQELILGASKMRDFLLKSEVQNNPALIYSLSKFLWDQRGYSLHYLMPYETRFKLLADWYVQLWGESIGKIQEASGLSVGPTPIAALGTSDQHSLLQLFKEGPKNRVIGFLGLNESNSPQVGIPPFSSPDYHYLSSYTFSELNNYASEATQESLSKAQIPTYRFTLDNTSPQTLGAFLFFQEVACAVAGEFYGVDAFNQPGVEETKQILKRKLRPS